MKRRTRRRLTTAAAVLAAGAVFAWTHNEYAAAIIAAVLLVLGLVRPPRRRARHGRPRRRRAPRIRRTTPNLDLEYRTHARYHGWSHTHHRLYVGIVALSGDRTVEDRIDEHLEDEPDIWAAIAYVTVAGYHPTRTEAFAAEAYDIHVLQPPLNRTHKTHPINACTTIATARARGYTVPAPALSAPLTLQPEGPR